MSTIRKYKDCADLNEEELLEIVAKYSPKSFYELKISYRDGYESYPYSILNS